MQSSTLRLCLGLLQKEIGFRPKHFLLPGRPFTLISPGFALPWLWQQVQQAQEAWGRSPASEGSAPGSGNDAARLYAAMPPASPPAASHPTNALASSASTYLRSAMHQPIQWKEWGA